jgi:hypothetical protein
VVEKYSAFDILIATACHMAQNYLDIPEDEVSITNYLPTKSRFGPTSIEFQFHDTFDGQFVKPS